jgi:D-threo-aldose 1-dehydrogenase
MRKAMLGRTGLEISELVLGGGVTAGILINGDEAARFTALRRAVMGGINWIDTAPAYGDGMSEETIGRHIESLTPRPQISTKVRLETEDMDNISDAILRSLEASLARLQVPRVELLQLHNHIGRTLGGRAAVSVEQVLGRGGIADTFDRFKEHGLIVASGLTVAGDTEACLEVINSGRFDVAQIYYNVINPSAAWTRLPPVWRGQDFCGVVAACFRQNMGVMNIRVWAGGALASSARPNNLPMMTSGTDLDNEVRCAAAVHRLLGSGYGTPAQTALRFVLGNRDITARVVGISEISQMEEAFDAVAQGPLPSSAISKLGGLWANDFQL